MVSFFSGFAIARISAPNCVLTWEWVSMSSFTHCMLWPLPGLTAFLFSHSILSAKMRAQSQRSLCQRVMRAVSLFARLVLSCVGEPYFPLSVFIVDPLRPGYSYTGPSGIDDSDLCKCSTVGYSLISACAGCQGEDWIRYHSRPCYLLNSRGLCVRH
jgi:hypothetical protein